MVHSVAFNSEHEDMVAYSGVSTLSIRTATFKPYRQRTTSLVVAFQGPKVYCLSDAVLQEEDVPLSSTVQQYTEAKAWDDAYSVACLGVTQEDWDALGHAALMHLELDTARKAFVRTQDLLMLNLVHRMEIWIKAGVVDEVLKAELLAHQVNSETTSL
jgi:intraflagellar transport protein 122